MYSIFFFPVHLYIRFSVFLSNSTRTFLLYCLWKQNHFYSVLSLKPWQWQNKDSKFRINHQVNRLDHNRDPVDSAGEWQVKLLSFTWPKIILWCSNLTPILNFTLNLHCVFSVLWVLGFFCYLIGWFGFVGFLGCFFAWFDLVWWGVFCCFVWGFFTIIITTYKERKVIHKDTGKQGHLFGRSCLAAVAAQSYSIIMRVGQVAI